MTICSKTHIVNFFSPYIMYLILLIIPINRFAIYGCDLSHLINHNKYLNLQVIAGNFGVSVASLSTSKRQSKLPYKLGDQAADLNLLSIHERELRLTAMLGFVQAETNTSYRAFEKIHEVYQTALPDCSILKNVSLSRQKINYVTCHGLAGYQKEELSVKISKAETIVLYLDTSTFHQLTERTGSLSKNLDLYIRFYDESIQRVHSYFLDVIFLASEKADIQVEALLKSFERFEFSIEKLDFDFL